MPFPSKITSKFAAAASMLAVSIAAHCQAAKPAVPAMALQPYSAPDQSASAGIPAGWKVTSAGQTVLRLAGPNGEAAVLGNTVIAHNAAFQVGQRPANGIDISMPSSASLDQKLVMILQQGAANTHKPISQVTINSATPLKLPPAMGQCGRFVASANINQGPMQLLAVLCSLPVDAAGNYKTIALMGQAPTAIAAQSAPAVQAIFGSYRIPAPWLQRKLAPVDAPAPGGSTSGNPAADIAAANMIMGQTNHMISGASTSVNCFDLTVLRQTPTSMLPRSCGGTQPD
jgi:hypothetical protein